LNYILGAVYKTTDLKTGKKEKGRKKGRERKNKWESKLTQ